MRSALILTLAALRSSEKPTRRGAVRHRAPDRRRCVGRRASSCLEFEHCETLAERGLDFEGGWGGGGFYRRARNLLFCFQRAVQKKPKGRFVSSAESRLRPVTCYVLGCQSKLLT